MKKIQLKAPTTTLNVRGMKVTNDNLTPELHAQIVKDSPSLAAHFEEVEVTTPAPKVKEKKEK